MHSLKKQTKGYIESLLEDYPNYDKYVMQREFELRHPYIEKDENVGGGKAQNKRNERIEMMLITIDEDKRLNNLRREHFAIKTCVDDANDIVQIIVKELYFKSPRMRTHHSILDLVNAQLIHISKSRAYILFDDFLEECAQELGLSF